MFPRAMALAATSVVLGSGLLDGARGVAQDCGRNSSRSRYLGDFYLASRSNRSFRAPFGFGELAFAQTSSSFALKSSASASFGRSTTTEPGTKIQFPNSEKLPGASKDLSLLGVGFREKTVAFINVKVYAVGFYADREALQGENLAKGGFEKGLRIVLARNINGALFSYALDDEMKPRMKSHEKVLAEFGALFKERNLTKGTVISFTWAQPSTLHVSISADDSLPSSPTASFQSQALASALFDVYLGEHNPVSPSLVASVSDGVKQRT